MPAYKTSKTEILEKCTLVFREKGYYHTTIAELAKACNIKKPHFYYYFSNKEHLMQEVLKYADSLLEEYICKIAYNDAYPPKARLEKMLARQYHYFLDIAGGCIFGNTILETANSDNNFKPLIRTTFNKWAKAYTYVLKEHYSMEQAEELAYAILQDFQGGMILYQLQGNTKYIESAKSRALLLL